MTTPSQSPCAGKHAVIIGGGVIGASWAALFLVNGMTVTICDPAPDIETKVRDVFATAGSALAALGFETAGMTDQLRFKKDIAEAVASADIVQECGPERPAFKQGLWKTIEGAAPADALLLSSSSSIPASIQASDMAEPGRIIIGHPFNPPHLMPLVEVVPNPKTDPALTVRVMEFYTGLGKVAVEIRKEIAGFVANRLQSAIFQECVYLVANGIVTLVELDQVVTQSLGIRWATNGPFLSFHLGGGPAGLPHFIEHLGVGMEQLWKVLGKASFDEPTKKLLIDQFSASYGAQSYEDLAEARDAGEIAIINGLARANVTVG